MKATVKSPVNIPQKPSETEVLAQQVTDLQIELDLLKGGKENA